jgi:hypothetical protein
MIKKIDGLDSKFDKFVEGYFNRVPKQFWIINRKC